MKTTQFHRSRINAPSFQLDRIEMRRLFLAVLWLTQETYEDRVAIYRKHRYHGLMVYMRQHRGKSTPSPIHEAITRTVGPKVSTTRLYISSHSSAPPSHCITIVLDATTGRWHTSAYHATVTAPKPKPGVFLALPTDAESSLAQIPPITRVFGASALALSVRGQILNTYEARRMASHCYIIGQCMGALYRGAKLPIKFAAGGAVVFTVDSSSSDGYVHPFVIEPYSDSPNSRAVEKPRAVFWGDAEHDAWIVEDMEQYILPSIRDDLILALVSDEDRGVSFDLQQLCRCILLGGIAPLVQIVRDVTPRVVDTVVPHYMPSDISKGAKTSDYIPVIIAKGTRYLRDAVPKIHVESGAVKPSAALLRLFAAHLSVTPETVHTNSRAEQLYNCLAVFGCSGAGDALDLFKEHKVRLTALATTRIDKLPWMY